MTKKPSRLNISRRSWLIGLASTGGAIAAGLLQDRKSYALKAAANRQGSSVQTPNLSSFQFEVVKLNSQGEIVQRQQRNGQKFAENLGNGIQLEMVAVPAGNFLMGAPETEQGTRPVERPQHPVIISAFYLGRYPITQQQWQAVMGNNPSHFPGENLPVESVSWQEAVEFCAKLSDRTGQQYRLPAEAEWEYACRAGTTTPFYFGETISTAVANYNGKYVYGQEQQGKYRGQTTPVGSFPANAFGLSDLHGNVWEWCADRWSEDYSEVPNNVSAWTKGDSEFKILRGGSWLGHPHFFRSACRYGDGFDPDLAHNSIGFRVCLDGAIG